VEKEPKDSARLDSWKEIASYLRRGTRTVQRWEREEGLPVRRLQHEKLGSVYAFPKDLDAWFSRRCRRPARTPRSIAVRPFADLSREGDLAWFCDGVAAEIAFALSRVEGLQIGREPGVQSLLQGSVRRSGNQLRISAQLLDAGTGLQLWVERYDRTLGDILEIQDEIAAAVTEALRATLNVTGFPERREHRWTSPAPAEAATA
jgi:TolB-like protein